MEVWWCRVMVEVEKGGWAEDWRWGDALLIRIHFSQIEVSHLEPEIAMATDCKVVTYNKGL